MSAPPTKQRRQAQARYASLTFRKPGSPEALGAGRDFFFVKTMDSLADSLARSPLPFTDEQRHAIADLLASA